MDAATELKGKMVLAEVDCTEETEIAKRYDIKSYPTMKLFRNGRFIENYTGQRLKSQIVEYMREQNAPPIPNHVISLDAENFNSVIRNNDAVFVKFFTPYVIAISQLVYLAYH